MQETWLNLIYVSQFPSKNTSILLNFGSHFVQFWISFRVLLEVTSYILNARLSFVFFKKILSNLKKGCPEGYMKPALLLRNVFYLWKWSVLSQGFTWLVVLSGCKYVSRRDESCELRSTQHFVWKRLQSCFDRYFQEPWHGCGLTSNELK